MKLNSLLSYNIYCENGFYHHMLYSPFQMLVIFLLCDQNHKICSLWLF